MRIRRRLALSGALLGLLSVNGRNAGAAQPAPPTVGWARLDCNKEPAGAVQRAVDRARPGDTILVSGTCNENLLVPVSADQLTLDGGGNASIHGPDPTLNTIQARAVRQLTVRGFTITGGRVGVSIDRGASALIDGNTIEYTSRFGIIIGSWSTANIINNTIQNNGSHGIQVNGSAFAFIGFGNADDTVASPNVIRFNGAHGINVTFSASARIAGNTISDNARNGVNVERASQATVSTNVIDHNGANGILVTENSGVNLGSDSGQGLFDAPNSTSANNIGSGVACRVGGYVNGRRGTLSGNSGPTDFGASCINSLDTQDNF
jgi:parallel beta-helix repeat protein